MTATWNEIGGELNQRRLELERCVELRQKVDEMAEKLNHINSRIELGGDEIFVELESCLEELQPFVEEAVHLQQETSLMELPSWASEESLVSSLKSKLADLVEKGSDKIVAINQSLDQMQELNELKLDIDGFLLKVSGINQSADDEEGSDDVCSDVTDGFDVTASLTNCEELFSLSENIKQRIEETQQPELKHYFETINQAQENLKIMINEKRDRLIVSEEYAEMKEKICDALEEENFESKLQDISEKLSVEEMFENPAEIENEIGKLQEQLEIFYEQAGVLLTTAPLSERHMAEEIVSVIQKQREKAENLAEHLQHVVTTKEKLQSITAQFAAIETNITSPFEQMSQDKLLSLCEDCECQAEAGLMQVEQLKNAAAKVGNAESDNALGQQMKNMVATEMENIPKLGKTIDQRIKKVREAVSILSQFSAQNKSMKASLDTLKNIRINPGSLLQDSKVALHNAMEKITLINANLIELTKCCDVVVDTLGTRYAKEFEDDIAETKLMVKRLQEFIGEEEYSVLRATEHQCDVQELFSEIGDLLAGDLSAGASFASVSDLITNCEDLTEATRIKYNTLRDITEIDNIRLVSEEEANELTRQKEHYLQELETAENRLNMLRKNAGKFEEVVGNIERKLELESARGIREFDSLADVNDAIKKCQDSCVEIETLLCQASELLGSVCGSLAAQAQDKCKDYLVTLQQRAAGSKQSLTALHEARETNIAKKEQLALLIEDSGRVVKDISKQLTDRWKECKYIDDCEKCISRAVCDLAEHRKNLEEVISVIKNSILLLPRMERTLLEKQMEGAVNEASSVEATIDEKRMKLMESRQCIDRLGDLGCTVKEWLARVEKVIDENTAEMVERQIEALNNTEEELMQKQTVIEEMCQLLLKPGMKVYFYYIFLNPLSLN